MATSHSVARLNASGVLRERSSLVALLDKRPGSNAAQSTRCVSSRSTPATYFVALRCSFLRCATPPVRDAGVMRATRAAPHERSVASVGEGY